VLFLGANIVTKLFLCVFFKKKKKKDTRKVLSEVGNTYGADNASPLKAFSFFLVLRKKKKKAFRGHVSAIGLGILKSTRSRIHTEPSTPLYT
jgi:DUF1365 family protein